MTLEDEIRQGQIIADGNANEPGTVFYRGVFHKGNFLLYRHITVGDNCRGERHPIDGYALAWTDMQGEVISMPPVFVSQKVVEEKL